MPNKKIGIIGATGYTGSELVRILAHHPEVEISTITSESRAGEKFSDVHAFFQGIAEHKLVSAEQIDDHDLDLAFLALPHGVSMDFVRKFKGKDFKIIDLSGDFRLSSPEVYESWYQKKHSYREAFKDAVFGLPELHKNEIIKSNLVANPGCYPTSAILAAAPVVSSGISYTAPLIFDAKSGVTGAGVNAKTATHFPNVNDNFKAYGIKKHRHSIEIQEQLSGLAEKETAIQFTPHLLPIDRGILTTLYFKADKGLSESALQKVYQDFYQDAPFVRLRNSAPAVKDVRGTNYCDIYTTYDERTGMIIIISVIDNLVKGAAGQAIQNMNLMFDFDEKTGLEQIPINP